MRINLRVEFEPQSDLARPEQCLESFRLIAGDNGDRNGRDPHRGC
jgi:hypothetical protein